MENITGGKEVYKPKKKRRNEKRRDQKTFYGSIADREKYSFVDLYNSVILNNQFSDKLYKTKQFRGNLVQHAKKRLSIRNRWSIIVWEGWGGGGIWWVSEDLGCIVSDEIYQIPHKAL